MQLHTIGHGTLDAEQFASLVRDVGIEVVVDVRRYPGSRRYPHFAREALAQWLPAAGVAYEWKEALGGRRSASKDSPNAGLRNEAFRGYADYMASAEFVGALGALLERVEHTQVAVMCSESLWWRCHRRLIADASTLLHGVEVSHLMHDGSRAAHIVTPEAVVREERVVYPSGSGSQAALL
jgi:uncharacterized protein (DUF488 family)